MFAYLYCRFTPASEYREVECMRYERYDDFLAVGLAAFAALLAYLAVSVAAGLPAMFAALAALVTQIAVAYGASRFVLWLSLRGFAHVVARFDVTTLGDR